MGYKRVYGVIAGRRTSIPPSVQEAWNYTVGNNPEFMYIRAERLLQFELCMAAIEEGLVPIYCPHSSAGCWFPSNRFVGICGFSVERLRALLPKP